MFALCLNLNVIHIKKSPTKECQENQFAEVLDSDKETLINIDSELIFEIMKSNAL